MTNIDERAEFEARYKPHWSEDMLRRSYANSDDYADSDVQLMFDGWQARASLNTAALAEKDAEIERLKVKKHQAFLTIASHAKQALEVEIRNRKLGQEIERLKRVVEAANNAYSRMVAAGLGMTDEGVALVEALAAAEKEGL